MLPLRIIYFAKPLTFLLNLLTASIFTFSFRRRALFAKIHSRGLPRFIHLRVRPHITVLYSFNYDLYNTLVLHNEGKLR